MVVEGIRHLARTARGFSPDTRRFLAGMFLMGLGHGAFMVHMNLYLSALGMGEAAIGRVMSAASVGIVAASLPAAVWAERLPAGRIFLLAAAGFSGSSLLMVLFPHPWVLLGLSFFSGALFSVHLVAEGPFFMRSEGIEHRTELFGIAAALETLAFTLAALGAGLLARALARATGSEALGLRTALSATSLLSLLALIPYSRIRAPPLAAAPRPWRAYVFTRDMGLILRLALPAFIVGCGAGLTIPFLNLYFRDRFHQDPGAIGLYYGVAQVLTMGGFLLGPLLARRFSHVHAVVATELLSIPFFLLLALTDHLGVALAAFWMRGALMNMNQPVSMAFAMEIVPAHQQAVANSVRTFAWNSAWMVSTVAGGWIIERHGYAPGMFVTMGLYLLAASLFWTFFRGRVVAPPPR